MIRHLTAAAFAFAAALSTVSAVKAEDFYAAPLNHGPPTNLPGEVLIPGATQVVDALNAVTQPILQPILAPGNTEPATVVGKRHHHHHAKHLASRHHHHVASRAARAKAT